MKNKKNIIAMLILLFISIICAISFYYIKNSNKDGSIANIYLDGKLYKSIDLSEVKESYEIEINDDKDHANIIKVEPNGISIVEADCPDKVCINTGVIRDGSLPIICLPNKVVIKIESNEKDKFDGKTF